MSDTFKAIIVTRDEEKRQSVGITELSDADLMEGDVTVKVEATTVNGGTANIESFEPPAPSCTPSTPSGSQATRSC